MKVEGGKLMNVLAAGQNDLNMWPPSTFESNVLGTFATKLSTFNFQLLVLLLNPADFGFQFFFQQD